MKKRLKNYLIFTGVLVVIIIMMLIVLIFPQAADAVAKPLKTTGQAVRNTAVTVITLVIGVMFVSWGVAALSVAPVIGVALIAVGLTMSVYALWTSGWFSGRGNMGNGLERIA